MSLPFDKATKMSYILLWSYSRKIHHPLGFVMGLPARINIGMGAWDIEPYKYLFYPTAREKRFRLLEFYSRFFDSVEVNATFYNAAFTPFHAKGWLADVAGQPDFVFLIKLYRGLTHTFDATAADILSINAFLTPLEEAGKLGGLLLQFPFRFTNRQEHRRYIALLSRIFRHHRVFIEVRHDSWHNRAMVEFFEEHGLCPVNVDLPQLPHFMPLTAASHNGYAYFRMMGRNAAAWNHPELGDRYTYSYSQEELDDLLRKITIVSKTARRVYVVFHNDAKGHSLFNGFTLRHRIDHQLVPVPEKTVREFPQLEEVRAMLALPAPLFHSH